MKWLLCLLAFVQPCLHADQLLVIDGAPGESSYAQGFDTAAKLWLELAAAANVSTNRISDADGDIDAKQRIQNWISALNPQSPQTVWIVYLGHGTFSQRAAKLNLVGPDLSAEELGKWLDPVQSPLVFIHGGSASAPFLNSLSAPNRIVITATRSGTEQNYARFGERFAQSINDSRSDLDLDGRISLLEAFVSASNSVEAIYIEAGRLSSEHALIDDNGDGKGTPATGFAGLRAKIKDESGQTADGRLARKISFQTATGERLLTSAQIERRDQLEAQLETLYAKKSHLPEATYYADLEILLNELSKLYLKGHPDS